MSEKKIARRSYDLDMDIIKQFDDWQDATGMLKNMGVQLGLWLAMSLTPAQRQQVIDLMRTRTRSCVSGDISGPGEAENRAAHAADEAMGDRQHVRGKRKPG